MSTANPSIAAHPRPLGHVSIGARDLAVSRAFYTAALAPLGLGLVFEAPHCLGFGPDAAHEILNVFARGADARPPGAGSHIAFNAANREAVAAFHAAAVGSGGTCAGEPGPRPHYGPTYFAAFVVCPDGWKIEAVYQEEAGATTA